MIKNINNKGSNGVLIVLVISTFILLLLGIVFIYRDKFSNIFSKFPKFSTKVNTTPQNETKTDSTTLSKNSVQRLEALDKEYFGLFTLENMTSGDKEKIKENIKKLRENQIEFQKEFKKLVKTYSTCDIKRSNEIELRNIEEKFILSNDSYDRDYYKKSFPRKRLDLERDYQMFCRDIYEKIGAKLLEF